MDDLGNRTGNITLRGGTVNFTVDDDTNRYTSISGSPAPPSQYAISYDEAGNLTKDHRNSDGYEYEYDYKNRLTKVTKPGTGTIVEYTYDALGRRIEKDESGSKTRYYYSDNWQVFTEYDGADNFKRWYLYGNYVDEVLFSPGVGDNYYYLHDHLYSPVALISDPSGTVVERYEYDAYGKCLVYTDDGADDTWFTGDDTTASYSAQGNPYYFTGRRLDELDNGDLPLMYYRNRSYDTYTGRFLQHDPLGYVDGLNLYQYVQSQPFHRSDPYGLYSTSANCGVCGPDVSNEFEKVLEKIVTDSGVHDGDGEIILGKPPTVIGSTFASLGGPFGILWYMDWNYISSSWGSLSNWEDKCLAIINPGQSADSWDITQLHKRQWIQQRNPGCATRWCKETVRIGSKCYHAGNANYAAYGVMMRLCGYPEWFVRFAVHAGKLFRGLEPPNARTLNWASAGYHWFNESSGGSIYGRPLPVSSFESCGNCPTSNVPPFEYNWEDMDWRAYLEGEWL